MHDPTLAIPCRPTSGPDPRSRPLIRAFGGVEGLRAAARALRGGPEAAGGMTSFGRDLARAIPHVPRLLLAIVRDPSVRLRHRAALVAVAALIASPIDAIPDIIPVLGSLDDAALALLTVRWTVANVPEARLREAWSGDEDSFEALLRLAGRLPDVDAHPGA